jgi:hypothetical protein
MIFLSLRRLEGLLAFVKEHLTGLFAFSAALLHVQNEIIL